MTVPPTPPSAPPSSRPPSGPPLPARVRVSRLPLPLSAPVAAQLARLCPGARLETVTQAAVALAGGRVVGALLRTGAGDLPGADTLEGTDIPGADTQRADILGIDAGWRGKGLEAALRAELASPLTSPGF